MIQVDAISHRRGDEPLTVTGVEEVPPLFPIYVGMNRLGCLALARYTAIPHRCGDELVIVVQVSAKDPARGRVSCVHIAFLNNAPGRSRTYDLGLRSPLLYPAELRAHAAEPEGILPEPRTSFKVRLESSVE